MIKFHAGDIVTFTKKRPLYAADPLAQAVVAENVKVGQPAMMVKWVRNGLDNKQQDGSYCVGWFKKYDSQEAQRKLGKPVVIRRNLGRVDK